ncbi:MAG: hypothetical protein ACRDSK_13155 [Actinophytocola sp.]
MSSLTLQEPAERGRDPRKVTLHSDDVATFGVCRCGRCPFELCLSGATTVPFAGQILAGTHQWYLRNQSADQPLVVADVDARTNPTTVLPGELQSFDLDMATAGPLHGADGVSVMVFFSPGTAKKVGAVCPAITPSAHPDLDPNARYSMVLTALCESVLLDKPTKPAPTSSDIAARLALSPRAVDSHIDYLIEKLGIAAPMHRPVGWKRDALIAFVGGHEPIARTLRTLSTRRAPATP